MLVSRVVLIEYHCGGGGGGGGRRGGYVVLKGLCFSCFVISAISKHLLSKSREQTLDKNRFSHDNNEFWLSSTIAFDLTKFKCKDYYWMFVRKTARDAVVP